MRVFRIENKDRRGPYTGYCDCFTEWQDPDHYRHSPPPCDEPEMEPWLSMPARERYNWQFGFTSTKQFRRWFTRDEQLRLLHMGFKLVVREVEQVIESPHQCVWTGMMRRVKNVAKK